MNIPHFNNRLLKSRPDQFCYELNKLVDFVNNVSSGKGIVTTEAIANGAVTADKIAEGTITADKLDMLSILTRTHPIGTIYPTVSIASAADMTAAFGGTWVAWGKGRVPIGVDTSDVDFNTVEKTGGNKTAKSASEGDHASGTGTALSVVQPYITVYLWKRTG